MNTAIKIYMLRNGVYSVDLNSTPYTVKRIWSSKKEAANGVEAFSAWDSLNVVISTNQGKLKFLQYEGDDEWVEHKERELSVKGFCDGLTVKGYPSNYIFAACGKTVHIFDIYSGKPLGKITSNSMIANTAVDATHLYLTAESNVFRIKLTEAKDLVQNLSV